MECSEVVLEGHARVLNVSVDALREFVGRFNEEIRNKFRGDFEYFADLTEAKSEGEEIKLCWAVCKQREVQKGVATYNIGTGELTLDNK